MTVYRICHQQYSDDLSGTGAKLFGGRWNSKGVGMLYVSEFISLTLLEMLVHAQFRDFAVPLCLLSITIPDQAEIKELKLQKLKADWISDDSFTKFIGDEFIHAGKNLIMKVPSAIVTEEHNFLINPAHPDFKKVKIASNRIFETDKRLFSI